MMKGRKSPLSYLLWIFAGFSAVSVLLQQGIIAKIHHSNATNLFDATTADAPIETPVAPADVVVVSPDYMLQHAFLLEQEAARMEKTLESDLANYKQLKRPGQHRMPNYRLHFFTYASDAMNLTKTRIVQQAERSGFFVSVQAWGPEQLPPDFVRQYQDILSQPTGGGFYLWRFPILEAILKSIDQYDYFLFIDSGCTVLSTGQQELVQWLQSLERASTRGLFGAGGRSATTTNTNNHPHQQQQTGRREIMRFPQESDDFAREIKWTTDRVFTAFNLTIEAPPDQQDTVWSYKRTGQFNGGLWLARNGPQLRRLLAFVYKTLSPDPYVITNRYNDETKKRRPGRFKDHRHDQAITSIACKILQNYILAPIMPEWKKPPFGVTRFRSVQPDQLRNWTSQCYISQQDEKDRRQKDEYCDELALSAFEPNTEAPNR